MAQPSPPRPALPIDAVLPEVCAALAAAPALVLVAPPGAGKTTRVPPALLDAGVAGPREVVVLEPRRLAARLAAARVAAELGEAVGDRVGYQIRFEERAGPRTRIRFVTEGVLTRRLLGDPELRQVGVVLLDEFHERHLAGDLALAHLRRLQRGPRPDLRIGVMSATIDPAPIAAFLGGCAVIRAEGRQFPVDIEYLTAPARGGPRPLEVEVAAALRRLLRDGLDGDVLVFLPGAAEIRRSAAACAEPAAAADMLVLPLHGDLPAAEQDRAIAPAERRKLILATNVAETSITIDGVSVVIDGGVARIPRHSPWSGLASLRVEPVSRAAAAQRAGRAGRTRAGRCLRLYTRADHDGRREQEVPEVGRADLAEAILELHGLGVADPAAFAWLDAPAPAAVAAADELLHRLGAIDDAGTLTETGRRMLRFPAHPRLARLIVEAERRGVSDDGCAAAAALGERDLLPHGGRPATIAARSDVLEAIERLEGGGGRRGRGHGGGAGAGGHDDRVDAAALRAAERVRAQLARIAAPPRRDQSVVQREEALSIAVLAGFPDRVARRRRPREAELLLAGGVAATLSPASVVRDAELLVAVDAEQRHDARGATGFTGGGGSGGASAPPVVRAASAVEPEWLLELFPDRIEDIDRLEWNPAAERVEARRALRYDGLVLDEQRDVAGALRDPAAAARVLCEAALAAGVDAVADADAVARLRARLAFVAAALPDAGIAAPTDDDVRAALAASCEGRTSFAELRAASLAAALRDRLPAEQRRLLDRAAPDTVSLPGRARVPVEYEPGRPPSIASRLQDFFGLAQGPSVAGGKVPLTLHLLAPNRRTVQVTTDLAGFWTRHYPAIRRELARRYPRHKWPEDPGRA